MPAERERMDGTGMKSKERRVKEKYRGARKRLLGVKGISQDQ